MNLFHQEHRNFFEGTLLLNAWYSCLYQNQTWSRCDVSLDVTFPKEWLSLNIGNISYEPTLKSKACLKCLYFTKIISALCCYLEYFSYLYTIN